MLFGKLSIDVYLIRRNKTFFSTHDNPSLLANKYNDFFTSIGETTAMKIYSIALERNLQADPVVSTQVAQSDNSDAFFFHPATTSEVENVIRSFSSNKSPGYDKISSCVLKDCLPSTFTTITQLMNNSFNTNTFTKAWKIAEVIPVLKSDYNIDINDPNNGRPISLLPVLFKISQRLAHSQFTDYLTTNKKLVETQSGNRKLHSTETALLHVIDELLKAMDEKNISILVLLDMSNAFDSINHNILLH